MHFFKHPWNIHQYRSYPEPQNKLKKIEVIHNVFSSYNGIKINRKISKHAELKETLLSKSRTLQRGSLTKIHMPNCIETKAQQIKTQGLHVKREIYSTKCLHQT
jgi:hypothetical protein